MATVPDALLENGVSGIEVPTAPTYVSLKLIGMIHHTFTG